MVCYVCIWEVPSLFVQGVDCINFTGILGTVRIKEECIRMMIDKAIFFSRKDSYRIAVPCTKEQRVSLGAGRLKQPNQLKRSKYRISIIIYSSSTSNHYLILFVISSSVSLHKLFIYLFDHLFLS